MTAISIPTIETTTDVTSPCYITSVEKVAGKYGTYFVLHLVTEDGVVRRVHARFSEYRDLVCPHATDGNIEAGPWVCFKRQRVHNGEVVTYAGKPVSDLVFRKA